MSAHTHRRYPSSGRTAGRACRYMRRRTHHWLGVRMLAVAAIRSDSFKKVLCAVSVATMCWLERV